MEHGVKKGVTFYFTDEGEYEEFLRNHKISGKTKSKFVLEQLIKGSEEIKLINGNHKLMGELYSSYALSKYYDISFDLPDFIPVSLFSEKKNKAKSTEIY